MNARIAGLLLQAGALVVTAPLLGAEPTANLESQIAPLLIRHCVECHQGTDPAGGLRLTTRSGMVAGGDSGELLGADPGGDESLLLERVESGEMPPALKGQSQQLSSGDVLLLKRWIASGAGWPVDRTLDYFERTTGVRAGRDWWSLQAIERPVVPRLKSISQPVNPIDAFVLARLEREQMVAAPPADKSVLLRRLYQDLIGLPPTGDQLEQFLQDESAAAWEAAIDGLLAMPQYGERWGRHWLDVARYADTSGYERDQEKAFAWKYRDWVISALNSDLPYDQFVIQQLAGDEIPNRSEASVIATGFLRLGTWNDEPNDPADYQYDRLEDLVHTTSSAFLALTVKCARCHSHKFDPITQDDYYRMASAFWAGPIAARGRDLLGGPSHEELGFRDVLAWTDLGRSARPLQLLKNGQREHPLHEVVPASLSMVPALEQTFDPPPEGAKTTHRRLQLASWIANPGNPLTARVLVNRLWLHHFGEAIVRSPNNFGFLADPPTHPELLDWLAAELVSGGWTIKRMHKLILTSKTWQQSSLHPRLAEYEQRDAGNRLWWRAGRRRLDAEAMRDAMLSVTGELSRQVGGPGFHVSIHPEALEGLSRKSAAWTASPAKEQLRRSVYLYSKRGLLPPMMTTFDLCDPTQSCGQRDNTILPTQALTLMNNQFVHDRSAMLAKTISAETSDRGLQVDLLWGKVYGRNPSSRETRLALQHLDIQSQRFKHSVGSPSASSSRSSTQPAGSAATGSPATGSPGFGSPGLGSPGLGALASLAHVLLNSSEFLYVD